MRTIKKITLEELQAKEMSEEAKKRIQNAVYAYDEENPPMTKEELESLRPVVLRHPEWFKPKKADVHLKIDIDVLEAFKAQGKGYQTRMNEVLRNYIFNQSQRKRQGM
jgi:uncharacterized protein (DUF4415 family)